MAKDPLHMQIPEMFWQCEDNIKVSCTRKSMSRYDINPPIDVPWDSVVVRRTIDRKTGVVMAEDVRCSLDATQIHRPFKGESPKEVLTVFFSWEEDPIVQSVSIEAAPGDKVRYEEMTETCFIDPEKISKIKMEETIVYTNDRKRIFKAGNDVKWLVTTKDINVAIKWSEEERRNEKSRKIYAYSLEDCEKRGGGTKDVSAMRKNAGLSIDKARKAWNVRNNVVLVEESKAEEISENIITKDVAARDRVRQWAWAMERERTKARYMGDRGALNMRMEKLIEVLRGAANAIMGKQEVETNEKICTNTRPYWPLIMSEVEKEKRILTRWCRAIDKYELERTDDNWREVEGYRKEWVLEWRIAKGELSDDVQRVRKENKMPSVSEEQRGEWRRMERRNDVKEIVFLRDVEEQLSSEGDSDLMIQRNVKAIRDRRKMLFTAARVNNRKLLYDEKEEVKAWEQRFTEGKLKGLINCIKKDNKKTHKIEKAVVGNGDDIRYVFSELFEVEAL